MFSEKEPAAENLSEDDEDDDEELLEDTPRETRHKPSKINCYLATVDGELYGRCEADGKFRFFLTHTHFDWFRV